MAGSPDTGPADPTFTRAILHLARSLQLTAIAEGIETEEQAAMLRALGRPMAQGYLFARPAPAAAITAYLDRDRGAAERRWLDHVPAALTLQA
ncbi:EAL domain-containing protein [Cryptosporangium minutisporangium]|uniref:EAL domain-containing protein n=1 Tax=Cryptosporangium minutisporangium TaxID=113569 RepID=UPI003CD093EF